MFRAVSLSGILMSLPMVTVLLAMVYAGLWLHATSNLRSRFDAQVLALSDAAYAVSHGEVIRDGFPMLARIQVDGISVTAPAHNLATSWGQWTWRAPTLQVTVSANPLTQHRVHIDLAGSHRLTTETVDGGPAPVDLRVDAGTLTIDPGPAGRIDGVMLDASGVTIADLAGLGPVAVEAIRLRVTRHDVTPVPNQLPPAGVTFALRIDGIGIPPRLGTGPLPRRLQAVAVRGGLHGRIDAGTLSAALGQWREQEGHVSIDRLDLRWGESLFTGEGILGLDPALRISGRMAVTVTGLPALTEAAADIGLLAPAAMSMARIVLTPLAGTDARGRQVLSAPLSIAEGVVRLNMVEMGTLPDVVWSGDMRGADRPPRIRPGIEITPDGQVR